MSGNEADEKEKKTDGRKIYNFILIPFNVFHASIPIGLINQWKLVLNALTFSFI